MQTSEETNNEYVEFQNGFQPPQNRTYYCFRTSGFGVNDWECSRVEPELQNQNRFKLCGDNKVQVHLPIFYIQLWRNITKNSYPSILFFSVFLSICFTKKKIAYWPTLIITAACSSYKTRFEWNFNIFFPVVISVDTNKDAAHGLLADYGSIDYCKGDICLRTIYLN